MHTPPNQGSGKVVIYSVRQPQQFPWLSALIKTVIDLRIKNFLKHCSLFLVVIKLS